MRTTAIFAEPAAAPAIRVRGRRVHDLTNVDTVYRKTIRTISLKMNGIKLSDDEPRLRVLMSADVEGVLHSIFALYDDDQEHLVMLVLNSSGDITGFKLISTGSQDHALADPRVIFRNALMLGAASIIISHNHPSGNTSPSMHDITMTRQLAQAGELMNITLLDHIIYSPKAPLSLKERRPELFEGA